MTLLMGKKNIQNCKQASTQVNKQDPIAMTRYRLPQFIR